MTTIYLEYAHGMEEFDLSPFDTVYYLRRILSEDLHLMESSLYFFRDGNQLHDQVVLYSGDVVQVAVRQQ